jgi:hypothetical protein
MGKTMKIRVGALAAIAAALLSSLALPAHGQLTINFTNIANTNVFGDGYVDPYYGTVASNGITINNTGLIVCDDYNDEITWGETWNVTAIQASNLNSGNIANTTFGGTIGLDGYASVASLVSNLLSLNSSIPAQASTQADLSAAIWYITSGGSNSGMTYSLDGYTLDANAVGYVTSALATYGTSTTVESSAAQTELQTKVPSLWILTPSPKTGYDPSGVGEPQEMWTQVATGNPGSGFSPVPEGGAALVYLALAGFACFGATFFRYRRQSGQRAVA